MGLDEALDRGGVDWGVVLVASARFGRETALAEWQLARAWALTRPVLYVSPPTFLHHLRHREARKRARPRLEQVAQGLHVLRPLATPGADRSRGAGVADVVLGMQVERAARATLPTRRVVVCADPRRGSLEQVERSLLVYWQRDQVTASATAREPGHLEARHRRLLDDADLVTGVSPALVSEAEAAGARALLVTNGCDFDHFARAVTRPADVPAGPIVGYAGGLSWRIDVDLIVGVADARPDWTVVLVGEVDTELPSRPNLVLAGRRDYDDLPAWLQAFTVGIVPYRLDEFNVAAFPLKVYEYLAAGRPVVSTPLPALAGMEPQVRLAADAGEFVAAIDDAIRTGPDAAACRTVARANSWSARARELERAISEAVASA